MSLKLKNQLTTSIGLELILSISIEISKISKFLIRMETILDKHHFISLTQVQKYTL